MKCMHCQAEIPEGQLYCGECGAEVQIVPDYNPLDEMLAAQVKGAISETQGIGRRPGGRNTARNTGRNTAAAGRDRGAQKRQAEKRKERARKKRIRALIITGFILVIGIIVGVLLYQNSYTGQVNKGYKALERSENTKAITHFTKAISIKNKRPEAYTGLSKVYIAQDDLDAAEKVFLDVLSRQTLNVDLYKAAIQFYLDTKQQKKVSILLNECEDENVLNQLKAYVSDGPDFSLPDTTIYEEVQELSLSSKGAAIYYTIDDTEPSASGKSSKEYTKPIQLDEGKTVIRAISVNKKGIPSLEVKKIYTIELPIEDAPAVTPSTGQYKEAMQIEVKVPEGYTAYYTTNGTEPSATNGNEYKGAINMPEGNTLFSAVLIDAKGRASDITKRNYELTYDND